MQRNQVLSSPNTSGSFALAGIQTISQFAHPTSQPLVRPDYYDAQGCWYRVLELSGTLVAVKVLPSGVICWMSTEPIAEELVQHHLTRLLIPIPFPPEASAQLPALLARRFLAQAPLVHIASASLGEAVIKAVIRQVISASQAKKLVHRLITQYGPTLVYEGTMVYGFPSLTCLADLAQEALLACGLGYKARIIPRIARELLEHEWEEQLSRVSTETSVALLQRIKGIGRWTARVAMCDLTGDWSVYPYEDLAVRTWARRLWPDVTWPHKESDFSEAWQKMHGGSTGVITFYTLAQANLAIPPELPGVPTLS